MNEAYFRAYYEAYNSGQEARLSEFLSDDVVLVSAQGEQRGKAAYLATYRQILSAFDDQMTPGEISIDGESAAITITDRFVAKQSVPDFLGRAFAKGEELTLRLLGRYTIRDGKIARIEIEAGEPM